MTRKELYVKVKELNVAKAIEQKYGKNFTRVSNANLEAFIAGFGKKEVKPKTSNKQNSCNCKEILIKLLSTLQARYVITPKDADEIIKML